MIVRPVAPAVPAPSGAVAAWAAIEATQKQSTEGAWFITQPSHAALSGDIAAKLDTGRVPGLQPDTVRAIALHDAGWGQLDAEMVLALRKGSGRKAASFLEIAPADLVEAWNGSIKVAEKISPAAGFMVSRHFSSIATQYGGSEKRVAAFAAAEEKRQRRLAGRAGVPAAELEQLTDLLRWCDLLSLYLCCGSRAEIELPELPGVGVVRVRAVGEERYVATAFPFAAEQGFTFAALRAASGPERASRSFSVVVTT